MLTKSDLGQFRKIIREEVENEAKAIKDELGSDITMLRIRIQGEIRELSDRTKNLEIRVTKMHKELKEEIKMVSHFLDKENIETLKRVKRIEHHLSIIPQ